MGADGPGRYARLTRPLVRRGGVLTPTGWDEALDVAAEGFRRTIDRDGPDAFGMFSCARATNEMNYVAQKFVRGVVGTNNIDSCNRTCHAPSVAGLSAVFGSGGGTSSYEEVEHTDLVVLWGSNARESHPIFFQHVLKAKRRGARLVVVDPRRTSSARWADRWLRLDVGTDIALASGLAREIIHAGLVNETFVGRATTGFADFAAAVEPWTPEVTEAETGVPAELVRELAHDYARADRAQLCWTLGITEHHNGTDNVLALINLALLTGHVGRYGSGLSPLRGQNNVQGGGDMGAIPDRLPGFQHVSDDVARHRFEEVVGRPVQPMPGMNLTQMLAAMERGRLTSLYVVGENPVQSEPDSARTEALLRGVEHVVVQDLFLTRTAELADVVLPATAAWCESDGTVTNSERRVQRVRKALEPPEGARDDIETMCALARRLGHDWARPTAEGVWDEVRAFSPLHTGMSYARLEEEGGLQWPCPSEDAVEPPYLHARLWEPDAARRGDPAPFTVTPHRLPVDTLDEDFPLRLTTGRRLESYNTGVQSGGYASPTRRGETLDISPADAARLGVRPGEPVEVASRRGRVVAPAYVDPGLPAGLVFMTFHFPDDVDTNTLTIDATDPVAGTAEYKATAVRVTRVAAGEASGRDRQEPAREPSPPPREGALAATGS